MILEIFEHKALKTIIKVATKVTKKYSKVQNDAEREKESNKLQENERIRARQLADKYCTNPPRHKRNEFCSEFSKSIWNQKLASSNKDFNKNYTLQ